MGRTILLILAVPYSLWLILSYQFHFIDYVNLALHEAGHLFLTPFGQTMHFLGGTIGQLVFPTAMCIQFLRQNQRFEAAACILWFGENVFNIAWYMSDAQFRKIPLVGGGTHDWWFLFRKWGILSHGESIGWLFHILASLIVIFSLWMMYCEITGRELKDWNFWTITE